jgi:thioredoxin-like negative regulator of GroEL
LPEWALARATALSGRPRLLAIVEDWCGDGSSTVPVLAKLADASEKLALRVIRRDENLDVMSRYLTDGTRSIPIVIVLDEAFRELGHWGPRPHELQQWVTDHKATMPKEERYRYVRGWYARDRGETMLREVLALVG